jgi:hypothetical protein
MPVHPPDVKQSDSWLELSNSLLGMTITLDWISAFLGCCGLDADDLTRRLSFVFQSFFESHKEQTFDDHRHGDGVGILNGYRVAQYRFPSLHELLGHRT